MQRFSWGQLWGRVRFWLGNCRCRSCAAWPGRRDTPKVKQPRLDMAQMATEKARGSLKSYEYCIRFCIKSQSVHSSLSYCLIWTSTFKYITGYHVSGKGWFRNTQRYAKRKLWVCYVGFYCSPMHALSSSLVSHCHHGAELTVNHTVWLMGRMMGPGGCGPEEEGPSTPNAGEGQQSIETGCREHEI